MKRNRKEEDQVAFRLLRGDRVIVHGQQRLFTAVVYFTLSEFFFFFLHRPEALLAIYSTSVSVK